MQTHRDVLLDLLTRLDLALIDARHPLGSQAQRAAAALECNRILYEAFDEFDDLEAQSRRVRDTDRVEDEYSYREACEVRAGGLS